MCIENHILNNISSTLYSHFYFPHRPQPTPSIVTKDGDIRDRVKKERSDFFSKDPEPQDSPGFGSSGSV